MLGCSNAHGYKLERRDQRILHSSTNRSGHGRPACNHGRCCTRRFHASFVSRPALDDDVVDAEDGFGWMPVQRVDNEVADAAECVDHGVAVPESMPWVTKRKGRKQQKGCRQCAHTVAPSDDSCDRSFKRSRVTAQEPYLLLVSTGSDAIVGLVLLTNKIRTWSKEKVIHQSGPSPQSEGFPSPQ